MNLKTPPEDEPDDEEQANELHETLTGMDYIPTPQRMPRHSTSSWSSGMTKMNTPAVFRL